MASLSDYLESGLLHHVFRAQSFPKPPSIAVALTTGVPMDHHTGATLPEVPLTINGSGTGYSRINLGNPVDSGNQYWSYSLADHNAGSGIIKNALVLSFSPALCNWGGLSGVALLDSPNHGSGNLLMHATINNPRIVYLGDSIQFDLNNFQIKFE